MRKPGREEGRKEGKKDGRKEDIEALAIRKYEIFGCLRKWLMASCDGVNL